VWGNGFTFRLTYFNNPEQYRDSCAQNLLFFSLISITNPIVVAVKGNPQDERNSLRVRGHISLLATNNGREPHLQNYNYKDCRKL
jgi:hypothetical protein